MSHLFFAKMNVRSCISKRDESLPHGATGKLDVIFITETWVSAGLSVSEFSVVGMKVFVKNEKRGNNI